MPLTKEQIVLAAVEVLDAEGVAGLNMRRLGAQLDSAATAMYYHVKSKDRLVELAADHVFGEIELPGPAATDWREAAAGLARGAHKMIVRHFWLIPAMSTHVIYGPNKARYDDHCLAVHESAGFGGADADRVAASILMFVIGAAQGEAAESALRAKVRRAGADEEKRMDEAMAEMVETARRFPRLRARMEPDYPDGGDAFEFGLSSLLNGIFLTSTMVEVEE
ncbi:TetR/AcrR family transcriptional regulator C-terminal domain-containing protein [Nonomuraea endophytica]|uniref:AcrR family transcriptional regulator n=1 Tax=Nonomuraea endophytica TaxID=714136 RepID=A0A7W7ZY34_9ACTN|nr:TetR/AcrR family transcriptional regulator C-terminal domain-containing protein [Nonomuraea endophytica]MBB5075952.1 AcrR family transcriptional regulator [Nonomuraea endophytica]